MPTLTPFEWLLAAAAALGLGLSKAGLAGIGLFHVVVFAFLFGARESTGYVLPLLVAGRHLRGRRAAPARALGLRPPDAAAGVPRRRAGGAVHGPDQRRRFKPLIGWIVLLLALMQAARLRWSNWMGAVPHTRTAVWVIGLIAGGATMLANAAGPVIALYCVAVGLPKFEVVGTLAWFFFIVNVFKLPFSAGLGLIRADTLLLTAVLLPAVVVGVFSGRWIVHRLPQRVFDSLMLAFAVIAALRLIFG